MRKLLIIILAPLFIMSTDDSKKAYQIFNSEGKETTFNKLVNKSLNADIILFGELHNNPINHWLELELSKALFKELGDNLIMGAEMFETDNALIIEEYLQGKIKDRNFETEARLWPNYKTDYKPLLTFARDSNITFVATNIPRRYAALVNKEGFEGLDSLNDNAKKLVVPLPVEYDPELSGYKEMLKMMEGSGHTNDNLPKAQAIKDATMAYFILKNLNHGEKFIHFHGTYHSDDYQGIMWYLQRANPDLRILTISSVEQDDISGLNEEFKNKADFILVTPSIMTKTH